MIATFTAKETLMDVYKIKTYVYKAKVTSTTQYGYDFVTLDRNKYSFSSEKEITREKLKKGAVVKL